MGGLMGKDRGVNVYLSKAVFQLNGPWWLSEYVTAGAQFM